MSVYIECEDPRVLAEHQDGAGAVQCWATQADRPHWFTSGLVELVDFQQRILAGTWRYRLVFPDPESAAEGLAGYAQRLGARVEFCRPGVYDWEASGSARHTQEVARLLATGVAYRIAAPEAPVEEPRPGMECATCGDDRTWGQKCPTDRPCPFDWSARPALPDGVEPVAWSERYGAWVMWAVDVPEGWWWADDAGDPDDEPMSLHDTSKPPVRGLGLVLARPVPSPPTERVPWHEAVGRRLPEGDEITSVRAYRTLRPEIGTDDDWSQVDADLAVEVLKEGCPR